MTLDVSQTIKGRYRIEAFLGEGGMAQVYKVWDQDRAVRLALKLLRGDLAQDAVFLRRFQREGQVLARLQHPHIVRFYGLDVTPDMAYMLMDYVDGSTLRKEIFLTRAPFTPERMLEILVPVCSALHYAHRQGLIHCDVKPANIMMNASGTVFLADFGISRMTEGAMTSVIAGAGTPAYMAPEQVKGLNPTPQTDIYALGIVLYEMATGGERPFTGERADSTGRTMERVCWEQVHLPPIPPRQANPNISPHIEAVIHKCLEKDPARRFNNTSELLNAFQFAVRQAAPSGAAQRAAVQRRQARPDDTPVVQITENARAAYPVHPGLAPSSDSECYKLLANAKTPALIIYLLDLSASMTQPMGGKRRIDIVIDALTVALRQMVFRSTKGARISPRYRVAMFGYSDQVYDLLDGIKTVDQLARLGIPELSLLRTTDTARGFAQVEKLLNRELPNLLNCPAPLVCHMTDGEYTGDDPQPIVESIMSMSVPDGSVLVENIFISDGLLNQPIQNPREWPGVLPATHLPNEYAAKLRSMSSPLPKSYHAMMLESGYRLDKGAVMMLPGGSPSLVEMGFVMSAATPVAR